MMLNERDSWVTGEIDDNAAISGNGPRSVCAVLPDSAGTPAPTIPLGRLVRIEQVSPAVEELAKRYVKRLGLVGQTIWLTESKKRFESWIGRPVSGSIGGAYIYLPTSWANAILINVARIDLDQRRSLEMVVCEEFLHMRHWLEGDRRGHAHHGYDRIAVQVAYLTGATMEEVRACLKPVERRPYKYVYACPTCLRQVRRRKRGTWSCGLCNPTFSHQHVLVLQQILTAGGDQDAAT